MNKRGNRKKAKSGRAQSEAEAMDAAPSLSVAFFRHENGSYRPVSDGSELPATGFSRPNNKDPLVITPSGRVRAWPPTGPSCVIINGVTVSFDTKTKKRTSRLNDRRATSYRRSSIQSVQWRGATCLHSSKTQTKTLKSRAT